ncbi:MAG: four helix bundle protein [Lentimicrobiaceae bacterium]|jgi:four helix bundle protein|nr:four helix bundle protein [Lentimicrobiaceae bacterium]MDD4596920.1 four helix bundle protein [Lentimicrobiaceae bacterium]
MKINSFRELRVYQAGIDALMKIFEISKTFPIDEIYSMTNQTCRASRSVCANTGEAWRRRRYKAAFIAKLNDSETEATETQVWLDLALRSGYITQEFNEEMFMEYESIISQLVVMINQPEKWVIETQK